MTLETMRLVTEELVKRGVPATLEYPGYICVTVSPLLVINYGDEDDFLVGDVCNNEGDHLYSMDGMIIPSDLLAPMPEEVMRDMADHITSEYHAQYQAPGQFEIAERIRATTTKAVDAFGAVLVAEFPEAKTGDFGPEETRALETALNNAIRAWVYANVKGAQEVQSHV